jgi:predicted dehydrogenase
MVSIVFLAIFMKDFKKGEACAVRKTDCIEHGRAGSEKVEIHYRNGTKKDITAAQPHPPMYYETREFIELIKSGKTESSVNLLANSLIVMRILEEARKQIGVVFPADDHPVLNCT